MAAGWRDPGAAFTAVTQIGTETAVLIYFRKDIARIVGAWCRSLVNKEARADADARMGWLVIIGSVPIGVLGLTLKDYIEGPFRDLRLIACTLIGLAVLLALADRYAARNAARAESAGRHRAVRPVKDLRDLNVPRPDLRLCQSLALVPGVSRPARRSRAVFPPLQPRGRGATVPARHPSRLQHELTEIGARTATWTGARRSSRPSPRA